MPLWTRTAKWREQIKQGDEVEIRESTSLVQRPKWHRATVLLVGGENDVPRELDGGAELEMIDVNSRRVPLMLLSLKRQVCGTLDTSVLKFVPSSFHHTFSFPGPRGSAPGNAQFACRHSTSTNDSWHPCCTTAVSTMGQPLWRGDLQL